MAQSHSKISVFSPIYVSCKDYVHPWTDSCMQALCGLYFCAILYSFRMYSTVYLFSLASKRKIPKRNDVLKTINGILQSTAFLSGTAFGYSAIVCLLRRIFGNYNILTVSFFPAFLSSVFSILVERPHRRLLLALYVSNIATETTWKMLLSRNWVKNVKHGDVAIFAFSSALLLTFYKGGWHKTDENARVDSMFNVLRFIVGPYEEKDYNNAIRSSRENSIYRNEQQNDPSPRSSSSSWCSTKKSKNSLYKFTIRALRCYKRLIERIKCCNRHFACPHPFSCTYYTLEGAGKMFGLGMSLQMTLQLLLNVKKIAKSPQTSRSIFLKKDNFNLALFLGGLSGLFRGVMCATRWVSGKDSPWFALPAGLVAGTAFVKYPNNTVALYVFWKMLQISCNMAVDRGYLPKIPGMVEFLYCFSTGLLFHVAIMEPTNLRSSYWKFLVGVSGGRIACMSRPPLDVWGLHTSEALAQTLKATKTLAVIQ